MHGCSARGLAYARRGEPSRTGISPALRMIRNATTIVAANPVGAFTKGKMTIRRPAIASTRISPGVGPASPLARSRKAMATARMTRS